MKRLSNTEAELKKNVICKKNMQMKTCFNNDLGKQLTIENSNIAIYLTATLGVVENKPA